MAPHRSAPWLIIGCGGQLGADLARVCARLDIGWVGARRRAVEGQVRMDLSADPPYESLLERLQPACVINAAAYTAVDAAEADSDTAWRRSWRHACANSTFRRQPSAATKAANA